MTRTVYIYERERRTKTYYVYYGYFGELLMSDLPVEGLRLYKTVEKANVTGGVQ